jgi:hypothetical protein
MRAWCGGIGLLTLAALVLTGCTANQARFRPPPHPVEFRLPPEDDPRYSRPPEYTKGIFTEELDSRTEELRRPGPIPPQGLRGPGPGGIGRR